MRSSCANTPNSGGQLAGFVGCTVRYVVPPVSFRSVVAPAPSIVGVVGYPTGMAPGGAAGIERKRETALIFVTT